MKRRWGWRWLFNLAAGVSLVLFLAMPVIWVRSYFAMDAIGWTGPKGTVGLMSPIGAVACGIGWVEQSSRLGLQVNSVPPMDYLDAMGPSVFDVTRLGGFAYATGNPAAKLGGKHMVLQAPCWFLTGLFAVLPAIRLRTLLRDRKTRHQGLCAVCGYDLRATPERCPECGSACGKG